MQWILATAVILIHIRVKATFSRVSFSDDKRLKRNQQLHCSNESEEFTNGCDLV